MSEPKPKPKQDLDERHQLPVEDPEEALRALLQVDPEIRPVGERDLRADAAVPEHGDKRDSGHKN